MKKEFLLAFLACTVLCFTACEDADITGPTMSVSPDDLPDNNKPDDNPDDGGDSGDGGSTDPDKSQIIVFKDNNLKEALLKKMTFNLYDKDGNQDGHSGDYYIDLNDDGEISISEAEQAKGISVYLKTITEFPELRYFTNISILHIMLNEETELELDLSSCKNLIDFTAQYIKFGQYSPNCPSLRRLSISHASLTEIDLTGVPGLVYLDFFVAHYLTSLDASCCPNLNEFSFSYCSRLASIDISTCLNLNSLSVENQATTYYLNASHTNKSWYNTLRDIAPLAKIEFK